MLGKSTQRARSGKTVPQLGQQSNQTVKPLKFLYEVDQYVAEFVLETELTKAQPQGEDHISRCILEAEELNMIGKTSSVARVDLLPYNKDACISLIVYGSICYWESLDLHSDKRAGLFLRRG